MIPGEEADIRDFLVEKFSLSEDDALAIAWAMHEAGWVKNGPVGVNMED